MANANSVVDDMRRGLLGDFQKSELLEIAKELELDVNRRSRAPIVIDMILADLDDNGIPDPDSDDTSELMLEFLVAAEFVDENGNILESGNGEKKGDDSEQELEEIPYEDLPECYAMADGRDPACKKCKLFDDCAEERVACRPECFSRLYDENAEECGVCIEANPCRKSKSS